MNVTTGANDTNEDIHDDTESDRATIPTPIAWSDSGECLDSDQAPLTPTSVTSHASRPTDLHDAV